MSFLGTDNSFWYGNPRLRRGLRICSQTGAQVLPEYRGQGIATNLVGLLKDETLKRGAIPYFGSFSYHSVSQSVGYAAGFFPCWSKIVSSPRTDEFLGYR